MRYSTSSWHSHLSHITLHFIHLPETDSTNLWLRNHADEFSSEEFTVVWTDHQTAGRGCGTNIWESASGENLLFSVLCHPKNIPAIQQFLLLETMALAIKDILDRTLPHDKEIKIKWPNDIYWHDSKLGGTLTECALNGQNMRWCIIGTGLNINQTVFSSQLHNPVSLAQITGKHLELSPLLHRICEAFILRLQHLENELDTFIDQLQEEYMSALFRRHGFHPFHDAHETFEAEIVSIAPDGTLTLRDKQQRLRNYKFKEISFKI